MGRGSLPAPCAKQRAVLSVLGDDVAQMKAKFTASVIPGLVLDCIVEVRSAAGSGLDPESGTAASGGTSLSV